MGAVYKARQKQLDRVVALKILPPGIGIDAAFAERFTREARALAKLNHPGIVTLYEFGRADGLFYFLMEFVDGVNLSELLGTGRVSARESLAIVPQICDALQYAHDQGIVHRDIKPENILLDRRGRVKVADFGLAKLTEPGCEPRASENAATAATLLTDAGKAMGTPQYMAPEQRDHPNEVDHRADIYALGVVFYQMLTGKLPNQPIEPPSTKVQIDVRLDEVVLRALERKPERRYQQASDLKTQVETVATVMGSGAAKTSPSFYKRMFAAITVVLCLVGAIYFQSRAHDFWTYQKSYLGNGTPQSPLFSVYVGRSRSPADHRLHSAFLRSIDGAREHSRYFAKCHPTIRRPNARHGSLAIGFRSTCGAKGGRENQDSAGYKNGSAMVRDALYDTRRFHPLSKVLERFRIPSNRRIRQKRKSGAITAAGGTGRVGPEGKAADKSREIRTPHRTGP